MLTVGIKRDQHVGATRESIVDPGLQGGTLTEIDRMRDHMGTHGRRDIRAPVERAVIDHDDPVAAAWRSSATTPPMVVASL